MSITVVTDVFCDRCGDWVHGVTSWKGRPALAREVAHQAGWLRVWDKEKNEYLDLCPICGDNRPVCDVCGQGCSQMEGESGRWFCPIHFNSSYHFLRGG